MYKMGSFADEIYQSMEKQLVSNQLETKYGFDKLAKAVDYLNAAATLFENANMQEEASEIVEIINHLAKNI